VLLNDEDRERCYSRNRGLDAVSSSAVLFLDDDDRLLPGALAALSGALDRHPDAVAAVGARVAFDDTGQRRRVSHPRIRVTWNPGLDVLAGWLATFGQMLVRTSAVREAGGWPDGAAGVEDQDLWMQLSRLGPATFVPRSTLEYRMHGEPRRHPGHDERERRLRAAYVDRLPPHQRAKALGYTAARPLLQQADVAMSRGEPRDAAGALLRAARTAPGLVRSPVVGPMFVRGTTKAVVGAVLPRAVARRATATVRSARARLGRSPRVHANDLDRLGGHPHDTASR
jgi:hypothetical protein